MKSLFQIVFVLFLGVAFTGCSDSDGGKGDGKKGGGKTNPDLVVNSKPGAGETLVVGDSLAYGMGATDQFNTPAKCLERNFSGSTVSNLAVPGLMTFQMINDFNKFSTAAPKLVFLSIGGNDAIMDHEQPGTYPAENSINEMKTVIMRYQTRGALVAFLALDPPYDAAAATRLQNMSAEAAAMGAVIIDGMHGMWGTSLMSDEFHPNDEGYKIMCNIIVESLSGYYP